MTGDGRKEIGVQRWYARDETKTERDGIMVGDSNKKATKLGKRSEK